MKLLLGCPTVAIDSNPEHWLKSFVSIIEECRQLNILVMCCFPYRKAVHMADNFIVDEAIRSGAEYILRMDDDVWGFPPGSLKRLLEANKEFISACMYAGGFPYQKCVFVRKDKEITLVDIARKNVRVLQEVNGSGVVPVDLAAFPLTLWKTSMFGKLKPPYFELPDDGVPEDSVFCQKCLDAGIQPYAHLDIEVCHRYVTPWNRLNLFQAEAEHQFKTGMMSKEDPLYEIVKKELEKEDKKDGNG